ncbi:hypothetical protein [Streptomyces alkaliterrae]|uniref:Cyclase n=1 Tax=Streptomyces alkaliterrae TaxID=2213162 RepID=A0A5P0YTF4_9ACTN|nr:hypothetical protein [Streptomyces alkaliterrae]MBB1260951.1 hypothetical protein [Streptomyces alkaliterrae]MQS02907.1 hypothetical protein [Streptomyces alkaliterrae]
MYVLRVQHAVHDYAEWKAAFDSDPLGREKAGVRSYRVLRPVDDPSAVMIDLEFDTAAEAEALEVALRDLLTRVTVAVDPQTRVVEVVEAERY